MSRFAAAMKHLEYHSGWRLLSMSTILIECAFIMVLILTNGLLAMAEIAIVSSRQTRLQSLASQGNKDAQAALDLGSTPNRFLSTVQIGITLIGILAGVFGGATLAEELGVVLSRFSDFGESLALMLVVLGITYLSLVIGELVPKRLGLQNPEKIALLMSRPMHFLSRVAAPAVWLLSKSTDAVLKLFRSPSPAEAQLTEEDVRTQIRIGAKLGLFKKMEHDILERVFRLEDVRVSAVMTPRPEIDFLDVAEDLQSNQNRILDSVHSAFPVASGRLSNLQGVVFSKDLLKALLQRKEFELLPYLKDPLFVIEGTTLLTVLEQFRKAKVRLGMVVDEYGTITGIVTLYDLLEAIIGYLPPEEVPDEPRMLERPDGTWLVDGMMPAHEFNQHFQLEFSPEKGASDYNTLAGFLLARMGRIPHVGDSLEVDGVRYEILDMDKNRIDKVLVTPKGKSFKS